MYAPEVIDQRLEMARDSLGWTPEAHSVSDVDEFNRRLEAKYADAYAAAHQAAAGSDEPGKPFQLHLLQHLKPILAQDEIHWMSNERFRSMCDASYWLSRYYYIKPPSGIQRFTFLPGQQVYFNVVAELESRGASIELLVSKARQHGMSTATEGFVTHRASFGFGVNTTIASADRVMTAKMAQMSLLAYDMMPWWMRPVYTRRVESDQGMLVFGGLKSGIGFQHGAQTSGISRGDTVSIYHLSEVASYANAGELIEDGLFKCVHAAPNVLGVLESTAEGDTGWWYEKYWFSKKNWTRGRSRLCPLFLPWFVGTDKYPTPTWIRTHPVPEGWRPEMETREMMSRAQLYVKSNPVLERVLGTKWELPQEQAWFWEVGFIEHRDTGRAKKWFQEMPTDDVESFQGSYDNVFGREVIASVYSKRVPDYKVYGIVGQSVETSKEPYAGDVDYDKPRIQVSYDSRKGTIYRWELVPLIWREKWKDLSEIQEISIPNGLLMIFRDPEPDYDYSIGVDTSTGVGDEATVIAVSRRARNPAEPDINVAEFRSNQISHVEAYAYVMAIAAHYARFMPNSQTPHREPYVSPEQVLAVGDTVYKDMWRMGYYRFHRPIRYDSRIKDMRKSQAHKRGWFTNRITRPILLGNFIIAVQNGWYQVNSPWTIWEMQHFEVHYVKREDGGRGREKQEHAKDSTDDGLFANAMAFFCPNDLQSLTERTSKKRSDLVSEDGEEGPDIELGEYSSTMSTRAEK